jgi:hypothetical protein
MTKARDLANAGTALSAVSATELAYLDGVTSAVQTQLNAKQAIVSGVDDTEIGYLNGVTSAIQTQMDTKLASATAATTYSPLNLTQNAQTGTTYTFVLADNGKFITATNASAQSYTIPPNSSVALPIGSTINLIQDGAGQVTILPGSGVTLLSNGGTANNPKTRVRYSALNLVKIGTDFWYCIGDIA